MLQIMFILQKNVQAIVLSLAIYPGGKYTILVIESLEMRNSP